MCNLTRIKNLSRFVVIVAARCRAPWKMTKLPQCVYVMCAVCVLFSSVITVWLDLAIPPLPPPLPLPHSHTHTHSLSPSLGMSVRSTSRFQLRTASHIVCHIVRKDFSVSSKSMSLVVVVVLTNSGSYCVCCYCQCHYYLLLSLLLLLLIFVVIFHLMLCELFFLLSLCLMFAFLPISSCAGGRQR